MPAIRRTPPGAEARRQSLALHVLLAGVYFLPLVLVGEAREMLRCVLSAVLSRLLLFDPVLNLTSGSPAFAVGSTALTDRALRWLAARLGWPAGRVRGVAWGLSLAISCIIIFFSFKIQ